MLQILPSVLGFSLTGSEVPSGTGTLVVLEGTPSQDCINNFKVAKNFFVEAKIAFYDSDSRAIENNGSLAQAKEMKRVIGLIEDSYIPSVEARMN